jgi:thiol-disulfide isomerase/thioredoxin
VRVVPCLGLLALAVGLAGCSSLGKKSATPPKPPALGAPRTGLAGSRERPGADSSAGVGAILAGQVLDSYNRPPPPNTSIQVTEAGTNGKAAAAPIEVSTDSHGYFMIQRLQPGQHYQLTARARNGDRMMAGVTLATPPNPKVLIQISEDFAGPNTPPLPGPPNWPTSPTSNPSPSGPPAPVWPDQSSPPSPARPGSPANDQAWSPGGRSPANPYLSNPVSPGIGYQSRPAELGPPTGILGPAPGPAQGPPPSPQPVIRPEGIANDNRQTRGSPLADIPSQSGLASGPSQVPSCVLTGNTLVNFALYDLDGRPWEFRDHRNRLVLLDFWGTWCSHCLYAIKDLRALQDRYGRYGLEVVGIDYERDSTPQEQILKVRGARQRYGINYQILLGGESDRCPVRTQFAVRNWPTSFLVDENNRVIWSSQGLGPQQLRELEAIIRQRLGIR